MDRINREEVELLLKQCKKGPCVSVFMPTKKGRERAGENSTRFKSLVGMADNQLEARGIGSQERERLLVPAKKLIGDSLFWANQSEGIALFFSLGYSRYFRLPIALEELALVRETFHLKPLFALLASDGQFYLLAISQKGARLLHGSQRAIDEIDLSPIVNKFEEEYGEKFFESFLQFQTMAPTTGTERAAMFHGHGGDIESVQKERLLNYFRFLDREISGIIDEKQAPLLLACVDYLYPLYKDVTKYPLLVDNFIKGNPENMDARELHNKAWEILKPYFLEKRETAKALYNELKGTGKTSNDILEIVPASFHGRVSDIFVTLGVQLWGQYDPESEEVKLSESSLSGSDDLIDMAAARTFLSSGNVYAVEDDQMPDESTVAAVLRW
jgi:hypothetical protein